MKLRKSGGKIVKNGDFFLLTPGAINGIIVREDRRS
jgi:hypothetical protein